MASCSIVIPTHNRGVLLERAVRSALAACPPDGEVLVVDDKSTVPASDTLKDIADSRLRVVFNAGASGASATRNQGVVHASGPLVFFLDDDDEILEDYCRRVLAQGGPASRADWGYAATIERKGFDPVDRLRARRRLSSGPVPRNARVRDRLAAMSDGLWIRKSLFEAVGMLDPAQIIDEDTDLCLRLLAAGRDPWYESRPGVIVYRAYQANDAEGAQLTVATPSQRGLECYWRTHRKNSPAFDANGRERWFMVTRFLRKAVKAGRRDLGLSFLTEIESFPMRTAARAFLAFKSLMHAIRRREAAP